jgi:hypothetical protein
MYIRTKSKYIVFQKIKYSSYVLWSKQDHAVCRSLRTWPRPQQQQARYMGDPHWSIVGVTSLSGGSTATLTCTAPAPSWAMKGTSKSITIHGRLAISGGIEMELIPSSIYTRPCRVSARIVWCLFDHLDEVTGRILSVLAYRHFLLPNGVYRIIKPHKSLEKVASTSFV